MRHLPGWMTDFKWVTPTTEERAGYQGDSRRVPKLGECRACGKRVWITGLGIGSHRRACQRTNPQPVL